MPFQMIADLLPGNSEAKLRSLLQSVPDALIMVDGHGRIVLANDQSARLFGYGYQELLGREVETLMPGRFRHAHRQHRAAYQDNPQVRPMGIDLNLVGRRKDGSEFPTEVSLSPLEIEGGTLVVAAIRDVSRQRELENTLRWQATVIDQIHDSVVSTDLEGYVTSWNKGAERLFGYTAEEALDQHISFVYPPEEHAFLQERVIKPLQTRGNHEIEVRMRRKSGEPFYAHLSLSLLQDGDETPVGMIGFAVDISQRKQAMAELQARARQQAVIADLGQQALAGTELDVLMERIVILVAQTLEVEYAKVLELLPSGQELLLKAGVGWKEGYVGQALVEAQTRSQAGYTLLSSTPVVVEDLRTETRFTGPPLLEEHGVISGASVIIHGQDRPFGILGAHTTRQRAFTEDDIHFLQAVAHVLGTAVERKWTEDAIWESETRFRQLAENIREVFWMTTADGAQILYASPGYEEIWGRSREALYKDTEAWLAAIHPADRDRVAFAYTADALRQGAFDEEYRIVRPDGSLRWLRDRGFPIHDERGQVIRIAGIATDITERREAEETLRRQAERLALLREIDHAILSARSLEEIAQAALRRIHDLLPCQQASVVLFDLETMSAIVLAVQTPDRSSWEAGERVPLELFGDFEALRQGKVHVISDVQSAFPPMPELDAWRADGVCSYINVPLLAQGGQLVGALSVGLDKAGTFALEYLDIVREVADPLAIAIQQAQLLKEVRAAHERLQVLSQRLVKAQEMERRRLSRELHDEIGQALTAVKLNLQALQRQVDEAAAKSRLQRSIQTVERTLQQVRDLSLDLRPALLDDLGLVATLRWYLDRRAQWDDYAICFSAEPPEMTLPADLETACFRVVQEALTNIMRHARARQVQVTLRKADQSVILTIEDDGIGFDVPAALEYAAHGKSLGLAGMQERALLGNGQLTIHSTPGQGTKIEVCFPLLLPSSQPASSPDEGIG